MEVLLLYLILPQRINFTQLARFGLRGEQTYRNLYSRKFDWLSLNIYIAKEFFKNNNGYRFIEVFRFFLDVFITNLSQFE